LRQIFASQDALLCGKDMLLPFNFQKDPYLILDFSANNPDLSPERRPALDLTDTAHFTDYVFGKLRHAGVTVGVGGYNEHRAIYHRSAHFGEADPPGDGPPCDGPRQIHLGIDFWMAAGTPVLAPLDGVVHSFQDNNRFGDYGPTIILEHETETGPLYSLYGHLSRTSLNGLYERMPVKAGEQFAEIGPYPENGDWPPHLHFQLMTDMLGLRGDFPGVCSLAERARFLKLCPDPNVLLQIAGL